MTTRLGMGLLLSFVLLFVQACGGGAPGLKVKSNEVKKGEPVAIDYGAKLDPPSGQQYWVTLVKVGAPDSEWGNWHYVQKGAANDSIVAKESGSFEVRLHDIFPKNSFKVIARVPVTVK